MWVIEKTCDFARRLKNEVLDSGGEVIDVRNKNGIISYVKDGKIYKRGFEFNNFYGSLELAKDLNQDLYFHNFDYSKISAWAGADRMLNQDYCLIPYQNFLENIYSFFGIFGKEAEIFIRPDNSYKNFTGRIFDLQEFSNTINDFEFLKKNELIVVSSPKKIIGEWRFACHHNEIIDKSLYRWQGQITEFNTAPQKLMDFVQQVINDLDLAVFFTLDVCMLEDLNTFKIVEANSLFSANLYACDPKKIINAI